MTNSKQMSDLPMGSSSCANCGSLQSNTNDKCTECGKSTWIKEGSFSMINDDMILEYALKLEPEAQHRMAEQLAANLGMKVVNDEPNDGVKTTVEIKSNHPLTIRQQLIHDYICAALKGNASTNYQKAEQYSDLILGDNK